MTIKAWKRTVQAALAEERSAWTMILTYADEAFERDPDYHGATSGREIESLRLELEAAGISMAFNTLKARAITGIHTHKATANDRETLTSVGWTIILVFAERGYAPEASAEAIRERRSSGAEPTREWAKAFVGTSGSPEPSPPRYSDARYMSAVSELVAHETAERSGEWSPSPMCRLARHLLVQMLGDARGDVDWDAELADLVAAEGGA